jgi:hypothetical protein
MAEESPRFPQAVPDKLENSMLASLATVRARETGGGELCDEPRPAVRMVNLRGLTAEQACTPVVLASIFADLRSTSFCMCLILYHFTRGGRRPKTQTHTGRQWGRHKAFSQRPISRGLQRQPICTSWRPVELDVNCMDLLISS